MKKGFSLVEMLIYISIITVIMLFVINTLLSFTNSYRTLSALRAADNAGMDAMEKMTRSIRSATSITTNQSTFGVNPGVLTLLSSDGSNSTTTKFYINSTTIDEDVNGSFYGPITSSNTLVTSLIFTSLATSSSNAVKIDLTVQGISGAVTATKKFHSTIVLKNS